MSEENLELVRGFYPPPDVDIAELFRDDAAFAGMLEAFRPLLTNDFESVMVGAVLGQPRTYSGLEGLRQNWLDWLEPWATYRTTIEELIDAGDRVVLLLRDHGRRKDMDEEVELIGASICTIRDGKVARWEDFADRNQALKAAGLSE